MSKKLLIASIVFICFNSTIFGQSNYGFELVGRALPGENEAAFAINDLCYLGAGNALQVLDVTDPASPLLQGQISFPGIVEDVFIRDTLAYIADGSGGLIVADISNPLQIECLGQLTFSDDAFGIFVDGDYAYIAGLDAGFIIVEISDPYFPIQLSSFPVEWAALNVYVEDNIACVACGYGGLYILDVSDPEDPNQLGWVDEQDTWAYDAKIDGDYAYMAYSLYSGGGGLKVINISNSQVVGNLSLSQSLRRIDYDSNFVFAASRNGGLYIIDVINPNYPHVVGGWQYGYGENISYDNYIIYLCGSEEGLRIFDASNVNFPQLVSLYHTYSACQDVAIAGQYAYLAEQPSGLKAIDISNPAAPMVTYSHQFYYEDGDYGGVSSGVSVVDGRLYVSDFRNFDGGDHDFRVYGLDDPALPESLGIFNDLNVGVRAHAVRNDIAYLSNSGTLRVLDVRNPDDIELVYALYGDWDSAADMDIIGNYIYLGTRETGLYILDISNEAWPEVVCTFDTEGETFSAKYHNGLVYLADYSHGLRIVNVDDFDNPYEVGYFIGSYEDCTDVDLIDDGERSYAIVGFDDQIVALDITDPGNPMEVGYYETGDPRRLNTRGDTIYVADRDYGLHILKLDIQVDIPEGESNTLPDDIFLSQNYPNPFNSSTIIEFALLAEGLVSIDIFDILGRKIASPFNGNARPGINTVTWNGKDLAGQPVSSGIYFYRITADNKMTMKRMVLLK